MRITKFLSIFALVLLGSVAQAQEPSTPLPAGTGRF